MNDGEHGADHQREDRDDLGAAGDGTPPLGVHEAEDRGDQRPRVTDADPEDKVRDVERPEDRPVETPDADAAIDLIGERADAERNNPAEQDDERPEAPRGFEERAQQVGRESLGVLAHASAWRLRYTIFGCAPTS